MVHEFGFFYIQLSITKITVTCFCVFNINMKYAANVPKITDCIVLLDLTHQKTDSKRVNKCIFAKETAALI